MKFVQRLLPAVVAVLLLAVSCANPLAPVKGHTQEATASTIVGVTPASRAITEPAVPDYRLFFKSPNGTVPQAYVWYTSAGATVQPFGTWNATESMTALGNGWYMADLALKNVPTTQTVGVIFKDSAGNKLSGTADQSRSSTGWCRMVNGAPSWTGGNPEALTTGRPSVTLTPIDNVITGLKTFTVTINDNGSPVFLKSYSVNDTSYPLSGTSFTVDGTTMAGGSSVSLMVKAENVNGPTVIGPHVFTKPSSGTVINLYFKSPWASAAPTLWLWEGAGTNTTNVAGVDRAIMTMEGKTWPGPAMTKAAATDWWYWTIPERFYPLNNGLKMKFASGPEVAFAGAVTASKYYNGSAWSNTNPDTAPSISAAPGGGFFSNTTVITLSASNPSNGYYTLGTGEPVAFNNGQTVTIGNGMANGESINLVLTSDTGALTKTYTFTKQAPATGITVYVKGYSKVYYWAHQPTAAMTATTWPGVNLGVDASGYKVFTFPGVTATNLIFSAPDGTVAGIPAQTPDLSRTTGVWWYKGGLWYDKDPEDTPPVINATPASAVSATPVSVTLVGSQASDKIYYTLDGTTPNASSTLYTGPITISTTKTLKAIGQNAKGTWGTVATFSYTVDPNLDLVAPTMTSNVASGAYASAKLVRFTFTDNKGGITAYYTTDGSVPSTSTATKFTIAGTTGTSTDFNVAASTSFNFLLVDSAGNQAQQIWQYTIGLDASNDFRDESIYFVITSRFNDGDTSNNKHGWDDAQAGNPDSDPAWRGDFKGLIQKLDYIKALGFSAVWITPVVENASGYDYHGYHALDHKQVDPRYLSADTSYQTLIDAVHAKGMKIIQDIVLNHTSNFGEKNLFPMFKKDWPNISGLNGDTPAKLVNIAPAGRLPANYSTLTAAAQYGARIDAMKSDVTDPNFIFHHEKSLSWESYTVQTGQIAGDCVDLNTENPTVTQYLRDAYNAYIDMGVDSFRVDTVKHISRLTFNKEFIPQFKARGGDDFFIFGEVATRYRQVWNSGIPAISTPFFTWKESKSYAWGTRTQNEASVYQNWQDYSTMASAGEFNSSNAYLNGNNYRAVDYSKRSGFDVIDFPMHWNFANARDAFSLAVGTDSAYSDATWNVVYVDSHDYAPDGAPENQRFSLGQDVWAENLALEFTFRGIPTVYYGSEIEFQKGKMIDVGPNAPLSTTGRAYFGDAISGSVTATDFGKYTGASGTVASTLSHPLATHIRELNLIRRAVPALRKGQYSTADIAGSAMAFKRRYTSASVDSFALVAVSGDATFSNIPNGTYKDAVTGDVKTVTNGSLYANAGGKGNLRVYVLSTALTPAPGKVVDAAGLTYLK